MEVPLDARAGVLRSLAFVAVRQQQDQAGEQSPLVLARRDELVDDDLRAICEIAKLSFPENQRLGIVAAVAVLVAHDCGFRENGVVDLEFRLIRSNVIQRNVRMLVLDIEEHRMAMIEGATLTILSTQADVNAALQERPECEGLRHAEVDSALTLTHLGALLEKLLDLGMNGKRIGIRG